MFIRASFCNLCHCEGDSPKQSPTLLGIAHRTGVRRKCRREEHPPRNDVLFNQRHPAMLIWDFSADDAKELILDFLGDRAARAVPDLDPVH